MLLFIFLTVIGANCCLPLPSRFPQGDDFEHVRTTVISQNEYKTSIEKNNIFITKKKL